EYLRNQFTDENVFWMTWGPGSSFANPPRRMAHVTSLGPSEVATTLSRVPARIHLEKDVTWDPNTFDPNEPLERWEKWWWELVSNSASGYYVPDAPFSLPGVDTTVRARVLARFWGTG